MGEKSPVFMELTFVCVCVYAYVHVCACTHVHISMEENQEKGEVRQEEKGTEWPASPGPAKELV